jgi:hypothetical protein
MPMKDSTAESLSALLRIALQFLLPAFLVLATCFFILAGAGRTYAGAMLLAIPAVVAALVWYTLRPPLRGDEERNEKDREPVAQALVGFALVGVIVLAAVLRFGDVGRLLVLGFLGMSFAASVGAILLGRGKLTYGMAALAATLHAMLFVLYTTTTKAYYFGATDLMAFFPSIERLIVTGDLDVALPEGRSSYAHIPLYFLFAAGGAFVTDSNLVHSLFRLFIVFYPAMGLAMVAMLRRLDVPERLAWVAFALTIASYPFLLEATYPTPRSLAVFLTACVLMLGTAMALSPKVASVRAVVVLIVLGIGLAFVHKVSGFMSTGPLLVIFLVAAPFLPKVEARVRRTLLWILGFVVVLHVTNSLFGTKYLREALQRIFDFGDEQTSSNVVLLPSDWTWGDTANMLLDNLGGLLMMTLILAGILVLLRRPDEYRMRNVGVALLAYLAMQIALLGPFHLFSFFTTTLALNRLAPIAFMFCALPAAIALVGMARGPRAEPLQPGRVVLAALFVALLVGASMSASVLNQDLAVNRRPNQYTLSFTEPELAGIAFGERIQGDHVFSDRLVARYYVSNPFTTDFGPFSAQVPPPAQDGFLFVRYPEWESGYLQVRIDIATERIGMQVFSNRLATDNGDYAELLEEVESSDTKVYDSGAYEWFRYVEG